MTAHEETLEAFKRLLDYECNDLKYWIDQSPPHSELWRKYQAQYNQLVLIRQKLTMHYLMQFLDKDKFDMPTYTERIFE